MARLTQIRGRIHRPFRPAYCRACAPKDAATLFTFHGCDDVCTKCGKVLPAGTGVLVATFKEQEAEGAASDAYWSPGFVPQGGER